LKLIHLSHSCRQYAPRRLPAEQEVMTMPMRSELPIGATHELSMRKQEGWESKLFIVALALGLVLLATVAVIFGAAPTDTVPIEAQQLIGP
jgi:hypothetical protein